MENNELDKEFIELQEKRNRASDEFIKKIHKIKPEFANYFKNFWQEKKTKDIFTEKHSRLLKLLAALLGNCEPCIKRNVNFGLENGATKNEFYETASIAAMMSANPNISYSILYMLDILDKYEGKSRELES